MFVIRNSSWLYVSVLMLFLAGIGTWWHIQPRPAVAKAVIAEERLTRQALQAAQDAGDEAATQRAAATLDAISRRAVQAAAQAYRIPEREIEAMRREGRRWEDILATLEKGRPPLVADRKL